MLRRIIFQRCRGADIKFHFPFNSYTLPHSTIYFSPGYIKIPNWHKSHISRYVARTPKVSLIQARGFRHVIIELWKPTTLLSLLHCKSWTISQIHGIKYIEGSLLYRWQVLIDAHYSSSGVHQNQLKQALSAHGNPCVFTPKGSGFMFYILAALSKSSKFGLNFSQTERPLGYRLIQLSETIAYTKTKTNVCCCDNIFIWPDFTGGETEQSLCTLTSLLLPVEINILRNSKSKIKGQYLWRRGYLLV